MDPIFFNSRRMERKVMRALEELDACNELETLTLYTCNGTQASHGTDNAQAERMSYARKTLQGNARTELFSALTTSMIEQFAARIIQAQHDSIVVARISTLGTVAALVQVDAGRRFIKMIEAEAATITLQQMIKCTLRKHPASIIELRPIAPTTEDFSRLSRLYTDDGILVQYKIHPIDHSSIRINKDGIVCEPSDPQRKKYMSFDFYNKTCGSGVYNLATELARAMFLDRIPDELVFIPTPRRISKNMTFPASITETSLAKMKVILEQTEGKIDPSLQRHHPNDADKHTRVEHISVSRSEAPEQPTPQVGAQASTSKDSPYDIFAAFVEMINEHQRKCKRSKKAKGKTPRSKSNKESFAGRLIHSHAGKMKGFIAPKKYTFYGKSNNGR